MVKFSLDFKFRVDKFEQYGFDQPYNSTNIALIYNKVALYWYLQIYPNGSTGSDDTEYRSDCGLFVGYKDGPKEEIAVSDEIRIMKDGIGIVGFYDDKKTPFFKRNEGCWGYRSTNIPTKIQDLIDKNYLSDMNTVLHVQAKLDIPAYAFDDSDNQFSVGLHLPEVSLDFREKLFQDAFDTINCRSDDDDRFEIISQDRRHFWVHKHIMVHRSPVFKTMFKREAGPDGQMIEHYKKTVDILHVSGAALELGLRYMYLGDVSQLNDQILKDVMLFASMYVLDDLMRICEQKLLKKFENTKLTLEEVVELSLESEKFGLKGLKKKCISFWAKRWTDVFDEGNKSCVLNRFYQDPVGQAFLNDLFNNTEIQKKLNQ